MGYCTVFTTALSIRASDREAALSINVLNRCSPFSEAAYQRRIEASEPAMTGARHNVHRTSMPGTHRQRAWEPPTPR